MVKGIGTAIAGTSRETGGVIGVGVRGTRVTGGVIGVVGRRTRVTSRETDGVIRVVGRGTLGLQTF